MYEKNAVIAIYHTHSEAEIAIKELQESGFDMSKLSISGREFHTEEHVVGFYNTGERMKFWGKQGAVWGGLLGILVGSGFFIIPGLGPIVVLGAFAQVLVGALEGAVMIGGLSALGAGLYSIGIPKDSIIQYETAIKAGKFLLIAQKMTADEVDRSKKIIEKSGAAEVTVHGTIATVVH